MTSRIINPAITNRPKSILESTHNTRELGGYKCKDGLTKNNSLWRSDAFDEFNENDYELLKKHGFTTIIDLRSNEEVNKKPDPYANKLTYYHFPIIEGSTLPPSLEEVPLSYMMIANSEGIKKAYKIIANANNGVLFHCTAGKDRTGVLSAIILMLKEVSDEDIIFDYVISREFNKERLERFLKAHPEVDRNIALANELSMEGFLKLFREKYHSVDDYLVLCGLTNEEIRKLKLKL